MCCTPKVTGIVWLVAFFCLCWGSGEAAPGPRTALHTDSIRPLQIGDTIPEALWDLPLQVMNHPEGKEVITLGKYRDKLIILDFWATYCKPCVASIQHFQQLLEDPSLAGAILLPVLIYDRPDNGRLQAFYERTDMDFMTVVNNTQLNLEAFRHYLTGFGVVWIAGGRLVGVPVPSDHTKEHLLTALAGEIPNILFRKGYPLNEGKQ